MKNLFDYATKELTQDAFLRWLFENWEDEQIKPIIYSLAKKFCGIQNEEKIIKIDSWAQWQHIDLTFYIDTNKNQYALFIEDKVFSSEHNQLTTYDTKIATIKNREIHKIFYKTSIVKDDERKRIEQNQNSMKANWEIYDINDIYRLFSPFKDIKNLIVNQYIEHISALKEATAWTTKPDSNNGGVDFLKWESYFHKVGDSILTKYNSGGIWKAGQFPYICLVFKNNENDPYLEIRSRDCLGGKFVSRILFYGVENQNPKMSNEEIRERQNKMIKKLEADKKFKVKNLRKNSSSFPRQIGVFEKFNVNSDEEFIELLKENANYYDELMKIWENC